MKSIFPPIAGMFFLIFANTSHASTVRELPLLEKVQLSDIVFIGKVERLEQLKPGPTVGWEFITVSVSAALKGEPEQNVDVWIRDSVHADNLINCSVGRQYVFFVVKTIDNKYESVDGRYGVIPIDQ